MTPPRAWTAALLGAALALSAAHAQEVAEVPEGHVAVAHTIHLEGLRDVPEDTRLVLYPATADGGARVIRTSGPLDLPPGVEAHLYAVPKADLPAEPGPAFFADRAPSAVTLTLRTSVKEGDLPPGAEGEPPALDTFWVFEGVEGGAVVLEQRIPFAPLSWLLIVLILVEVALAIGALVVLGGRIRSAQEGGSSPNLAVNPPVFFLSGGLLLAFITFGALYPHAQRVFGSVLGFVSTYFGWLYVLAVAFFIAFALWLLFSRHARIRLGDDDERPEFGTFTWFSMLFSAGMGIGLVFYGVAEPISHYTTPPLGEGGTAKAATDALPLTFFHWGIHAWAIYVLMALSIAYFSFRRKLPLALRSCFYPLLGERIHGTPGHVIDIIAVFGTLFGLATSLGLGAMQVSAGIERLTLDEPASQSLFWQSNDTNGQLILIAIITFAATISLVTGVKKGIRRLSELNLMLAGLLMLFVFLVGPTLFIVNAFMENVGNYLTVVATRTFRIGAFTDDKMVGTTLFYWGWWIAWSPFVGMFVARISRGRTIREFILGVLLVPTFVTFVWMTVFGDTALYLERVAGVDVSGAVSADVSTAIYVVLEQLPLAAITSFLAAAVVAVFFVTSSDSASFVVDMLTSGGHPDPPIWQRVFWAVSEGACAGALLYAGGEQALKALQSAVVSIGLPFCVVILLMCWSLARGLREEHPARKPRYAEVPDYELEPGVGWAQGSGDLDAPTEAAPAPAAAAAAARAAAPAASKEVPAMPQDVKKILVPVDYSDHSRHAIEHAVELAETFGAKVDVLHVGMRPVEYLPLDEWIWGEEKEQHHVDKAVKEAAEKAFEKFVGDLPEEVRSKIDTRLELGAPVEVILDVAKTGGYDWIIMGTHGRTGRGRFMLGSVAERVVRSAPCPVLTVR